MYNLPVTIGIDPGLHTGVGISSEGKIRELLETDFWGCIDIFNEYPTAFFVVEMPKTKHVWHNESLSIRAAQRTGLNVGSVLRESQLLIDYLDRNKMKFKIMEPMRKIKKSEFNQLTGWTGRTNQHMRDAAMLSLSYKVEPK